MKSFQAWFQRLPLPAFFVAVFVLWVGIRLVLSLDRLDEARLIGDAVGGLIFAGITTGIVAARRRRLGGREQVLDYGRAVKSGVLPADVDPARWQDQLDADHRAARRSTWLIPLLVVIPVAAAVLLLVLEPRNPLPAVLLIAIFICLAVLGVITSRRQRKRIEALGDQLHARQIGA